MQKGKAVSARQEIRKEVEKGQYASLSEFISEEIRLRLQKIGKARVAEQLLYAPRNIWIRLTPQGNVRLGVSDYFERQLKGIVYVGNFKEGDNVSEDEPFGTIETVAPYPFVIHDIYSPIDGMIVKVNEDVLADPYILNGNTDQWIVEIRPDNPELVRKIEKLLRLKETKKP